MIQELSNPSDEPKPFYVYEIQDPDSGQTFYVGKGQNGRAWTHPGEKILGDGRDHEKLLAMDTIRKKGNEPRVVLIGRFDTEAEALAVESVLIKWIYGLANLTNMIHGHRHAFVRTNGYFDPVPGIDIQKVARTGEYTARFLEAAAANDIPEKLEIFEAWIKERSPTARTQLKLGQSPSVFVNYNDSLRLRIILSAKGTGRTSVQLTPVLQRTDWLAPAGHADVLTGFELKQEYAWLAPESSVKMINGDFAFVYDCFKRYADALQMLGHQPTADFDAIFVESELELEPEQG